MSDRRTTIEAYKYVWNLTYVWSEMILRACVTHTLPSCVTRV